MAEDDEDFQERVDFVYNLMDKNKTGVSYMLFLSWCKAQAKEAGDEGFSTETLNSANQAFGKYGDDNGVLPKENLAILLKELDLLKYVPEDVRCHYRPGVVHRQGRMYACACLQCHAGT